MNKRITITATHGDRLTIIIGRKQVTFNSYSDESGFVVTMDKEELKKYLEMGEK